MSTFQPPLACVCLLLVASILEADEALVVTPTAVHLRGPESTQQLIVSDLRNSSVDLTRQVQYSTTGRVVDVDRRGRVIPLQNGSTTLTVVFGERRVEIPVEVSEFDRPQPVSFRRQILPILSKRRCNSGGCHGKAEGQNGFKLSVFGFDAIADFEALRSEGRGRRLSLLAPSTSLLLTKATAETPHGGGQKIEIGDLAYRRLARWIGEGARMDSVEAPTLQRIEVNPPIVVMQPDSQQQLQVTALDSNGLTRCVTHEAEYQSNSEAIAGVHSDGLISVGSVPGEAAILVRYMEQVTVCRVMLPQSGSLPAAPSQNNFIDQHVAEKLKVLGIGWSQPCDDATFLRRVSLDTTGALPSVEQAKAFLSDDSPRKRERLVRELLQSQQYAAFWTMRWADILRVDKSIVAPQGAVALTRWIRKQIMGNVPYDQFVRQLVTARGDTFSEGPASFYKVHKDAEMAARAISQVFLGVRLECAQCHHHPAEAWSQHDYYAFANMFSEVALKKSLSGGSKVYDRPGKLLVHPRTGEPVAAAPLRSPPIDEDARGRREILATWMTQPDNPFFAKMIVNRLWAHYFGRGLVEPIDDMRATNPASNQPLFEQLARHLRELNYDLKAFTETILSSRTYQLQSETTALNEADAQNYSHSYWKPLPAEVLLDAICDVTGVPQQFNGWPLGVRAVEVWDNRMPSYFFRVFGRPQRVSVCECERGNEPSIAQCLHLMNADETVEKIRHRDGIAARLAASSRTPAEIISHLYLATLTRQPTQKELELMQLAFEGSTPRRQATEDVLWALINSREFIFNH